ncbi:uncharacterized protein Gasu_33990 [Galdieria sulphuraria]|uniref:GHMP kinase N-terminal domain-containing protein n=1 Tax=Galdieria sulphuraria TaxID=130081 RepID=M2XGK5_GALSU|nr:uncharacterized protein Gasu_33990 [Galdieria sulphuraria]EME29197.1 hypothetical protein Gasu_33990 [Galdieria sulphuraria]|eukprot:XP_005705717.1 hypothetical protein Gasu_33990 [Galdieria sulphuraria]
MNTVTSNENRMGAIRDLWLAVEYLHNHNLEKVNNSSYIVIAGDTLVPFLNLQDLLTQFLQSLHFLDSLVVGYEPKNKEDLCRRGVFRVQPTSNGICALDVIEKPSHPSEAPSSIASIPVYLFSSYLKQDLEKYISSDPTQLRNMDAPGHFLSWLCSVRRVYLYMTPYRLDIGNLAQYQEALWFTSCCFLKEAAGRFIYRESNREDCEALDDDFIYFKPKGRTCNENAVGRALPRVGLIGNPSDGYGGKVISCTIEGCGFAQVIAEPSDTFGIVPHPIHDSFEFSSLAEMNDVTSSCGFYGGLRLLQAACVVFYRLCEQKHVISRNCKLHYSSTIPRQVGFGGSSALIVACFRCLATFYQIPMLQLAPLEKWPTIILQCETELLSISAGLQDRVAQIMEGVIYMDFSELKQGCGQYERLKKISLPDMYLAWLPQGKFSGTIHSNLGARWRNKEPLVLQIMHSLGELADKLRKDWREKNELDSEQLANYVDTNFEYRRQLLGNQVIGRGNLEMIQLARQEGWAAKLVGSGGAILCVPKRPVLYQPIWKIEQAFRDKNFSFCKLQIAW